MTAFKYTNLASPVQLSAGINDTAQTLTVGSTTSFPSAFPFLLGIDRGTGDEEVVLCTAKTGTTFTVTRGYDNTTGVAHDIGALVEHVSTAITHRRAGIAIVTTAERDALSGEDVWVGRTLYNSTSAKLQMWSGSAWVNVGPRAGSIEMFGGAAAPMGTLLCTGQAVSRTTYVDLFAVVGTAFGAGDGSTSFNLPDLQQRFPVGAEAGGDYDLADTGGAASVTLTEAQIPSHLHSIGSHTHGKGTLSVPSGGSHLHSSGTLTVPSGGAHHHVSRAKIGIEDDTHTDVTRYTAGHTSAGANTSNQMVTSEESAHTHTISGSTGSTAHSHSISGSTASGGSGNTGSTGDGESHENRPPFIALNFIIYT